MDIFNKMQAIDVLAEAYRKCREVFSYRSIKLEFKGDCATVMSYHFAKQTKVRAYQCGWMQDKDILTSPCDTFYLDILLLWLNNPVKEKELPFNIEKCPKALIWGRSLILLPFTLMAMYAFVKFAV